MDIQHLIYFVTVAEQKNFTRAAKQLFVSQPMLTRCIKSLESELNVRLIERTSKSFRLTDAGQVLFVRAKQLLGQYDNLLGNLQDVKQGQRGEVRISSPGVLLDMYFPQLLSLFRQQYPGIDISIVEEGSKLTVTSVLDGSADLGLVMLPVDNMPELDIFPVVSDEVWLMVRKDHPFATKPVVHIGELRGQELITYSHTSILHDTLLHLCAEDGFVPRIICKSLMPIFATQMLSLNPCVGVFPRPIIARYQTDDLAAVRLEPRFPWQIAVILKKGRYCSFATTRLIEFIKAYFQTLPSGDI